MSINTLPSPNSSFSLDLIQDEVRQLVEQGAISRHQPIHTLCQYIPPREWRCLEVELEKSEYLLRDRIADLLGKEIWDSD